MFNRRSIFGAESSRPCESSASTAPILFLWATQGWVTTGSIFVDPLFVVSSLWGMRWPIRFVQDGRFASFHRGSQSSGRSMSTGVRQRPIEGCSTGGPEPAIGGEVADRGLEEARLLLDRALTCPADLCRPPAYPACPSGGPSLGSDWIIANTSIAKATTNRFAPSTHASLAKCERLILK